MWFVATSLISDSCWKIPQEAFTSYESNSLTRGVCIREEDYLSFSMLALDLHIVVSDLHTELIGREVLDVQVDCELIPVRSHLRETDTENIS